MMKNNCGLNDFRTQCAIVSWLIFIFIFLYKITNIDRPLLDMFSKY